MKPGAVFEPVRPKNPLLRNLHRLRGLAALTVVLSHFTHWHHAAASDHGDRMLNVSGMYAVGMFFVISGFIIARSHREELGKASCFRAYAIKRLFRIFPAYWVYSGLFILLGVLGFQSWDHSNSLVRNPLEWVSALTLLPIAGRPDGFLAVSWSLYYEIIFYSVFAFFFVDKRLGFSVLAVFALGSIPMLVDPLTSLYCINRIDILFLAGVLMGLYGDQFNLTYVHPLLLTVAGGVFFAYSTYYRVPMDSRSVYASSILLVAGAVVGDLRAGKHLPGKSNPFSEGVMWLGTISYSLYLCHVPVQTVLYRYLGSPYRSVLIGTLYVAAPVLVASIGYLVIENRARLLRKAFLAS